MSNSNKYREAKNIYDEAITAHGMSETFLEDLIEEHPKYENEFREIHRRLEQAIGEYYEAIDKGESPEEAIARLRKDYPEHEEALQALYSKENAVHVAIKRNCKDGNDEFIGKTIDGYQIIERLGSGAMGVVYRARSAQLGNDVAIKIMSNKFVGAEEMVARFGREMRAGAAIKCPNVAQVLHAGSIDEKCLFFVMEYIAGIDLLQVVKTEGILPWQKTCEYIRKAALGLQAIHENGFVHRDVKPSNIMLSSEGEIVLVDLGLVLKIQEAEETEEKANQLTSYGQAMGTPDFMAPEQFDGAHDADIRSDIYSLGCTLYMLLSGNPPFGEHKAKMAAHQMQSIEIPKELRKELPTKLIDLIQRMLEKEKEQRPQTPHELIELLDEILTPPPPPPQTATHHTPAVLPKVIICALILTVLSLSALWIFWPPSGVLAVELENPETQSLLKNISLEIEVVKEGKVYKVGVGKFSLPVGKYSLTIRKGENFKVDTSEFIINDSEDTTVHLLYNPPVDSNPEPTPPVPPPGPTPKPHDISHAKQNVKEGVLPWYPIPQVKRTQKPGPALSHMALVSNPAKLPGVESWTIDTRESHSRIWAAKYSPDGRYLATSNEDGVIRIRDAKDGRSEKLLLGHSSWVLDMAWLPDSDHLITCDMIGEIIFWDVAAGGIERKLHVEQAPVMNIALSPDGSILVTGGTKNIRFWKVNTGELIRQFPIPAHTAMDWSTSRDRIATAGLASTTIRISDANIGELIAPLEGHESNVERVAFSPNGELLASSSIDGRVRIWSMASNSCIHEFTELEKHLVTPSSFDNLAWSPKGDKLALGHDSKLWILDIVNMKILRTIDLSSVGICGEPLTWSPDGKKIFCAGGAGNYGFYEVKSGQCTRKIDYGTRAVMKPVWSPFRDIFAIDGRDRTILIGDFESNELVRSLPGSSGDFKWSPMGDIIATGSANLGDILLWDPATATLLHRFKCPGEETKRDPLWSPDGQFLAVAGEYGDVYLCDRTGSHLNTLRSGGEKVESPSWSYNGKHLAGIVDQGRSVKIWKIQESEPARKYQADIATVHRLAWSPESNLLAVSWSDQTIRICDPSNEGNEKVSITSPKDIVDMAWSPNGKMLASWGKRVWICDSLTGEEIGSLKSDVNYFNISAVTWSPDSHKLVAGFGDYVGFEVHLWDSVSKQLEFIGSNMEIYESTPQGFRWALDSNRLVSIHWDNTLRFWNLETGGIIEASSGFPPIIITLQLSSDGNFVTALTTSRILRLWNAKLSESMMTLSVLNDGEYLILSPDGHYHCTPKLEKEIVYVVQVADKQETLSLKEFADRYGWENIPEKAKVWQMQTK